jgi:two-component sensor histidine kinase
MLSSLLSLQRSSVSDHGARRALQEACNRVNVISRIQRNLYSNGNGWNSQRLRDLISDTVTASNLPSAQLRQSIDVEELPPEAVVPVGLVMLELVSNALEHSGGRTDLEIRVELTRDGERYRVIVADNGVGFPDGFDPKAARSLGMRIVTALVRQLRGELRVENRHGATAIVLF